MEYSYKVETFDSLFKVLALILLPLVQNLFIKISQFIPVFYAKHKTFNIMFFFFFNLGDIHCQHVILAFRLLSYLKLVFLIFLGGFLSDAGWYSDAEKVFLSCLQLCTLHDEMLHWFRAVECCVR